MNPNKLIRKFYKERPIVSVFLLIDDCGNYKNGLCYLFDALCCLNCKRLKECYIKRTRCVFEDNFFCEYLVKRHKDLLEAIINEKASS